MTTMGTINTGHFAGHQNVTEGQRRFGDTVLEEFLEQVKVDIIALEAFAAGVRDPKDSCRMATAAALGAVVAAGTGVGKTLTQVAAAIEAIDGITPVVGNRVLVKNQVAPADNGIYTITVLGTGAIKQVLTRATDADTDAEVTSGMTVPVSEGTINLDSFFMLTTNDPIVVDTTAQAFAEISGDYEVVGNITSVDAGDAAAAGTNDTSSRGDHQHAVSTAAPGAVGVATASAVGAATDLARSDHAHQSNTAPADSTKAAAAIGVSGEPARADHKHDVSSAAPGATGVATASADGVATSMARSDHAHQSNTAPIDTTKAAAAIGTSGEPARADHKHDASTAAPAAVGVATAAAEGTATSLARSDHAHISNTAPTDTTKAAAAIGTSGEPARADHKHDASTAATGDITGANAEGAATSLARSDHDHKLASVARFMAHQGIATGAGNAAAAGAINAHRTFDFDDGLGVVDEQISFEGVIPEHYSGGDLTVVLSAVYAAAAGDVVWDVSFERMEAGVLDIDAGDGYAAVQSSTDTVPGTIGFIGESSITFTQAQADGVVAGDLFRLLVTRDSNNVADDTVGDASLLAVNITQ